MPATFGDLSSDLLRLIFEQIDLQDKSTFRNATYVCQLWQYEAERRLYHTYHYSQYGESDPFARSRQQSFLTVLATSARHAKHVRRVSLQVTEGDDEQDPAFLGIFCRALQAMTDLLRLECWGSLRLDPESILAQCQFPLLQSLCWHCFEREEQMFPFFQAHPHLVELEIDWQASVPVGKDLLPNLEYLEGGWGTLARFLPGRNIRFVERIPYFKHTQLPPEFFLGAPYLNVHSLLDLRGLPITELPNVFPNVVTLELTGPQLDATSFERLSQLRRLQHLCIKNASASLTGIPVEQAMRVFEACPSLELFAMHSGFEPEIESYHCFKRSPFKHEIVDHSKIGGGLFKTRIWIP